MIFSILLLDSNEGYSFIYIYVLNLMESKINEEINFWIYVNKYMVIYEKRKKSKKKKERERLGA